MPSYSSSLLLTNFKCLFMIISAISVVFLTHRFTRRRSQDRRIPFTIHHVRMAWIRDESTGNNRTHTTAKTDSTAIKEWRTVRLTSSSSELLMIEHYYTIDSWGGWSKLMDHVNDLLMTTMVIRLMTWSEVIWHRPHQVNCASVSVSR